METFLESLTPKKIITSVVLFIITIIFLCMLGCERIDAGNVGLKVNAAGGDRGVSKTEYVTGWVFYLKPLTRVYEFPIYQQHKEYEPFEVPSKGGTVFNVHPTFNYNITPGNVAGMFSNYRVSLKQLEDTYLKNALYVSLRETTNTFTVDSIVNNLASYDIAVLTKLNEKLQPYFTVSTFTSGLTPDAKLTSLFTSRSQIIQEALQLENQQKKIKVQVENDLLEASRDSAVAVKAAKAESESKKAEAQGIIAIQQALAQSPQYVELKKAEKWDGKLPETVLGSGQNMFLNVGK